MGDEKFDMADSKQKYVVRADDVKIKTVGKDRALFVKNNKSLHVLNPTALFVYECLKEPVTFEELVFMMNEVTGADQKTVDTDLKDILDVFLKNGVVRIL